VSPVLDSESEDVSRVDAFPEGPASRGSSPLPIAGERHARVALAEYIKHYDTGRSRQGHGLDLRAPDGAPDVITFPAPPRQTRRRQLLGGLINEYQPAA
jgi:hypothetical protein